MVPSTYKMVDLDGIDLAEVNGSVVPGIYNKVSSSMNSCRIAIFCNWKFADIVIAPAHVLISVDETGGFLVNDLIAISQDDTVKLIGVVPEPVLQELNVTANGEYLPPEGVDGFSKVNANVPDIPPVVEELSVTENGVYTPSSGVDGFSRVNVNVPDIPPVVEELNVTENGVYIPEAGVDGFSRVSVDVPAPGGKKDPIHFDASNGYVSGPVFYYSPSDGLAYDVYQVTAGRKYVFMLGQSVGNRFRVAFFTTDPYYATSDVSGTSILENNSPAAYELAIYNAPLNGYVVLFKSNSGAKNISSYCIDLIEFIS